MYVRVISVKYEILRQAQDDNSRAMKKKITGIASVYYEIYVMNIKEVVKII